MSLRERQADQSLPESGDLYHHFAAVFKSYSDKVLVQPGPQDEQFLAKNNESVLLLKGTLSPGRRRKTMPVSLYAYWTGDEQIYDIAIGSKEYIVDPIGVMDIDGKITEYLGATAIQKLSSNVHKISWPQGDASLEDHPE